MSAKTDQHTTYLGDGVYASYDGYNVILDLRGQDDTTQIALEPEVLVNLDQFRKVLEAHYGEGD